MGRGLLLALRQLPEGLGAAAVDLGRTGRLEDLGFGYGSKTLVAPEQ